jgi:hypothetical protein
MSMAGENGWFVFMREDNSLWKRGGDYKWYNGASKTTQTSQAIPNLYGSDKLKMEKVIVDGEEYTGFSQDVTSKKVFTKKKDGTKVDVLVYRLSERGSYEPKAYLRSLLTQATKDPQKIVYAAHRLWRYRQSDAKFVSDQGTNGGDGKALDWIAETYPYWDYQGTPGDGKEPPH